MVSFSIITCTFNAAQTLEVTLRSVLSQDFKGDVEHIVVDGLSKVSTVARAQSVGDRFNAMGYSLRVLSEKDRGLYDAMNKGTALASRAYLLYLNAGDACAHARTLSQLADIAQLNYDNHGLLPGVLYGQTSLVDANRKVLGPRHKTAPDNLTWRSFSDGMLVCHQAFYALRELALKEPYNLDYRFSADVDWCIRVMKRCENEGRQLCGTNEVVCHYLSEGMTTQNHRASLLERFKVMNKHYGLITTIFKHIKFLIQ